MFFICKTVGFIDLIKGYVYINIIVLGRNKMSIFNVLKGIMFGESEES